MSPSTKRILRRERCREIFRHANAKVRVDGQWLMIDEIKDYEPRPNDAFAMAMRNLAEACKNASNGVSGLSAKFSSQP